MDNQDYFVLVAESWVLLVFFTSHHTCQKGAASWLKRNSRIFIFLLKLSMSSQILLR